MKPSACAKPGLKSLLLWSWVAMLMAAMSTRAFVIEYFRVGNGLTATWTPTPGDTGPFMFQLSGDLAVWTDVPTNDPRLTYTGTNVAYNLQPGAVKKFVRGKVVVPPPVIQPVALSAYDFSDVVPINNVNGHNGWTYSSIALSGDNPHNLPGNTSYQLGAVTGGSSQAGFPTDQAVNTNREFSFTMWVKPSAQIIANSGMFAMFGDYNWGKRFGINTAGKLAYYIGPYASGTSAAALPANQWSHIAVQYQYGGGDLGTLRIYINGVLDQSIWGYAWYRDAETPDGSHVGASNFSGVPGVSNDKPWGTLVDDVRYYNSVISTNQILSDRQTPVAKHASAQGAYNCSSTTMTNTVTGNHGALPWNVVAVDTNSPRGYFGQRSVRAGDTSGNNGQMYLPADHPMSTTAPYSISFWVKPTAQMLQNSGTLLSVGDTLWGRRFGITAAGKISWDAGPYGDCIFNNYILTANSWHHLAIRYPGGNLGVVELWVNGVLRDSNYGYHGIPYGGDNGGSVGAVNNGGMPGVTTDKTWGSLIDDIRIYPEYLWDDEIIRDYKYPVIGAGDAARGHLIIANRGLQIQAQVSPSDNGNQFDRTQWTNSGFTTVNFQWDKTATPYLGTAPGMPWGRWLSSVWDDLTTNEIPYATNIVSMQLLDEQVLYDTNNVNSAACAFALWNRRHPDVLGFANQSGDPVNDSDYRNYMQTAKPDLLLRDLYPHLGEIWLSAVTREWYYDLFEQVRARAMEGNDGTGQNPIPFGLYLQTFVDGNRWTYTVSESELYFQYFNIWTMGGKFASAFVYNDIVGADSLLFNGAGESSPTPLFDVCKEANAQSKRLGSTLVKLMSTGVYMQPGQYKSGIFTYTASSPLPALAAGSIPYLTSWTVSNLGTVNDGKRGDLVVGKFKLIDEELDGGYTNETYFMVQNGHNWLGTSSVDTRQTIELTFNFSGTGITQLQKVHRATGNVEDVSLTSLGSGNYKLTVTINGGQAELYKYKTGAPFVR